MSPRNTRQVSRFDLAPMSAGIRVLTYLLFLIPIGMTAMAITVRPAIGFVAAFVVGVYLFVWYWMRPTAFEITEQQVHVHWPLRRRAFQRSRIREARIVHRRELMRTIGWAARIGAGGLWGGFGLLWTTRRGLVQMYVSRTDRFVWIERSGERPWLITPEQMEEFVESLA
jgi:hypothetical protein